MTTKQAATGSNFKMVFKLLALFKGYIGALAMGLALLLITTVFTLLPSFLIKQIIDTINAQTSSQQLFYVFLIIIGATFMKGILYYLQRIIMESTGQKIVHELRSKVLLHLNRLDFTFFDHSETGDLVSRVTSDVDLLARFYGFSMVNIINNIFILIGILAVLIYWSPLLSLAFLALLPFMVHAMLKYANEVRPLMNKIRKSFGRLTTSVQQSFSGIETIKQLGTEQFEFNKFNKQADKLLEKNIHAGQVSALWLPYVHFLTALGTAFTLLWGGWLTINGSISHGMLFGFLTYMGLLLRPIRQTGMLIGSTMTSAAAAERVFNILDQKAEALDKGIWPEEFKGHVAFEGVSFSYTEGHNVLEDVNLDIAAHQTTALVGPSGAGKSTLINLIPGFYSAQQGKLTIDGIDITKLNIHQLRKHVGYLRQHPFFFDGTILENLTFGKPDATMEEVVVAAKRTMLHDFIKSLPKKYQTKVGEKGVMLSGGQKQRLAMARVLITNPTILILDEPTSNLDKETEEKINLALVEVIKQRTVVIIAHRLWTIKNADVIAFVKDGHIHAMGNHQALLASSPAYQAFLENQTKPERSVAH